LKLFQSSYSQCGLSPKARLQQRRAAVNETVVPDVDLDVQTWNELPDDQLAASDEYGWAPIHYAARKGALHIIERAIVYNKQLMEQKTIDVAAVTPLLIAVQVRALFSVIIVIFIIIFFFFTHCAHSGYKMM